MTLPAPELRDTADDLLDVFLNLTVPEGYRAELIQGEIVVSPTPDGDHENIVALINRRIVRDSAREVYASGTKGLAVSSGRFIPDSVVGPVGLFHGRDPWMAPDGVLMAVEVTSARPGTDRHVKRRGYAEAEIPLYLLVDRSAGQVILYSEPGDRDYRADARVPFGSALKLPEPFAFTLHTAPFA
ncbi:MAG: Uma2 family endonuclease [Streptosporangiaceae bacterium]